jgi:hypothetical protein
MRGRVNLWIVLGDHGTAKFEDPCPTRRTWIEIENKVLRKIFGPKREELIGG